MVARAFRTLLSFVGAGAVCLLAFVSPAQGTEWKQAEGSRTWSFPRDHGAHLAYRTEWWYFTGNLTDKEGRQYGYQLTFFRQGIQPDLPDIHNPWSLRDLYLAHFTVTEGSTKSFVFEDRVSRTGPGLAGARTDGLHVWLLDWSADGIGNRIALKARGKNVEISLDLTPRKPIVLHGRNGLSRKGSGFGQASYYASYTDLKTTGFIRKVGASEAIEVEGISWFDHEFGSNQLTTDQSGWDWFSLHLSDGRDLMIYMLRRIDGSVEPASSGTLMSEAGSARHLTLPEIRIDVLDHWKSDESGAVYPSRWRIRIPSEDVDLFVSPLVAAQELLTPGSTGITYWEGAVNGRGTSKGRPITCEGYIELTGYAGKMGGLF